MIRECAVLSAIADHQIGQRASASGRAAVAKEGFVGDGG